MRLHSKNYEWVGAGVIRGRILFLSAKAIVRILFEGDVRVLLEEIYGTCLQIQV